MFSAVASVEAVLSEPRRDRPYEGLVQIHADISPMAGVEYDSGGMFGASESRERAAPVSYTHLRAHET